MRFLSVCSGIEAASVAWRSLGWRAHAFAETEAFSRAVFAHHYPSFSMAVNVMRWIGQRIQIADSI